MAFLSRPAQQDLMEFIAGNGENYQSYRHYAECRGWQLFTPGYLHNWVSRRRPKIQALREIHKIEVRKSSLLDREARIAHLEAGVRAIAKALTDSDLNTDTMVKLLDQQRKNLQAIAQERGEWGQKAENQNEESAMERVMKMLAREVPQLAAPEPGIVVDAEGVRVIEEATVPA